MNIDERDEFIEKVKRQIKFKPAASDICKELSEHIEDKAEEYCDDGLSKDKAVRIAVMDMGSPEELGNEFNKVYRLQMPYKLLGILGFIIIFSALTSISHMNSVGENTVFRDVFISFLRMVVLIPCILFSYPMIIKLQNRMSLILFLVFVFLFFLIRFFILGVNRSWIAMAGWENMFPILLTLLSVPALFGFICDSFISPAKGIMLTSIGYFIVLWAVPLNIENPFYFIYQIIFILTFFSALICLLFRTKVNKNVLFIIGGLCLFFTMLWIYAHFDLFENNLGIYVNNEIITKGSGNEHKIMNLLYNARLIGQAELNGEKVEAVLTQYYYNNYRIAYWILKYGWILFLMILAAIVYACYIMMDMVINIQNELGYSIALACSIYLILEILFYLVGNFGYQFGNFGVMPFISEGVVGCIGNAVLTGIIISIYRYDKVSKFIAAGRVVSQ